MTSIPHTSSDNGEEYTRATAATADTPITIGRIRLVWPLLIFVASIGGAGVTLTYHSQRISSLEDRQEKRTTIIDDRLQKVEQGVATLLERTRPR